jgi:hypothetical protein
MEKETLIPMKPDPQLLEQLGEDTVVITGRSNSDTLYDMSREFLVDLPWPKVKFDQLNSWHGGLTYAVETVNLPFDWVINIDIDCFILDVNAMFRLLLHMRENGYDVCGYPEGGVMRTRRKNPVVPNQFFNIIHSKNIRPMTEAETAECKHRKEWEALVPEFVFQKGMLMNFCDLGEYYYKFFFRLLERECSFLYLDACEARAIPGYTDVAGSDHLSVAGMNHEGARFLVHTWGGRSYGMKTEKEDRIDRTYAWAKRAVQE